MSKTSVTLSDVLVRNAWQQSAWDVILTTNHEIETAECWTTLHNVLHKSPIHRGWAKDVCSWSLDMIIRFLKVTSYDNKGHWIQQFSPKPYNLHHSLIWHLKTKQSKPSTDITGSVWTHNNPAWKFLSFNVLKGNSNCFTNESPFRGVED